jgi:hypothetical protein
MPEARVIYQELLSGLYILTQYLKQVWIAPMLCTASTLRRRKEGRKHYICPAPRDEMKKKVEKQVKR